MKIIYEKIIGWAVGFFVGPKLYLAIALGALVVIGGIYLKGYFAGQSACELKGLKNALAVLEKALKGSEKIIIRHSEKALGDDALDKQNQEVINELPSDSRICLDQSHIDWLRKLK